ncbi:MAG: BatA domain-containing protein [Bacteroidia bacterium]|jgi:hypothetical protein|nr:BatA domain-containing protein [Bacteroidia bacterium]GIV23603.1 MAG: hypothetical protein KatS3mg025_1262 [Bacteroidia bacterium]
MHFLHPTFLWGLVALLVPILVHFFYLRRARRYEFSQGWLIEALQRSSRPYLRLHHLILLFIRLLLVLVVVLLFARPYWGQASSTGDKASVLVVVDVSPSMEPGFTQALLLLKEAIGRDPAGYEYRLLTTQSLVPEGGFVSRRVLLERLQAVKPADMGLSLATLLERPEKLFLGASYQNRKVYILSDFQASSVGEIGKLNPRALGEIVLFPAPTFPLPNAYIDSLSAEQRGGRWVLRYKLSGTQNQLYKVSLQGRTFRLTPGWYEEVLNISNIPAYVCLSIEGDAVDFDNQVCIGIGEAETIDQQAVWQGLPQAKPYFDKLHRVLGRSPFQTRGSAGVSSAAVEIVMGALPSSESLSWVIEGGTLVVFPQENLSPATWEASPLAAAIKYRGQERLSEQVSLRPESPSFWEKVFVSTGQTPAFLAEPLSVSVVYDFLPYQGRPLLKEVQGRVLLWEISWGKGRIYLFAFPWHESLANHSLFVPLFERIYVGSLPSRQEWIVWLGKRKSFYVRGSLDTKVRLRALNKNELLLPAFERKGEKMRFFLGDVPITADIYRVEVGERAYAYLGVNISPSESVPAYMPVEAWQEAGFSVEVRQWEAGRIQKRGLSWGWRDWWGGVLFALLLIAAEVYWSRRLLRPVATVPAP